MSKTGAIHRKYIRIRSTIPMKIVLIFIAVLVPIYALLVISASAYLHSLETQALQNAQSILDINMAQMEAEIDRIDAFFYDLQENDADFQHLLRWTGSDADKLALYKVNQTLRRHNTMQPLRTSFYVYLSQEDQLLFIADPSVSSMNASVLRSDVEHSWYAKRNARWMIGTIGDAPYLYHTVENSGIYYGAMIHLEKIMDTIREEIPYRNVSVRLDYRNEESGEPELSAEIHKTKQFFIVTMDRREIREAMPLVSRIILAVGLVIVLLVPLILIFVFMRMIVRPIRFIEEGMFRLGSGEQDYRIRDFNASREFVGMKNSFNNMASEIQNLRIRHYEEELEREQMILQNLLLQIRPHFLLNFFNQIFSMAELEDYQGIKKSSLYLSRFFRYLFRSDRIATLRSELELVDAYLELMEERFMDCFSVERDVDEDLLEYRVPPLIVQNFVENIFKYAVSDGNFITIGLSLRKENGYAVITISDDGPGMEEEVLERIRDEKPVEKTDGTHIGIYNSLYRLKKLCGEDTRLEVQSVLTEGTTIRILLPEKESEKEMSWNS